MVLSILLAALFATVLIAQETEFLKANKFYENKDYPSAIRLYQAALARDVESAPLYFNLGNAYFKNGDLGLAILNYIRASRLDPSDRDIKSNFEFAKRFSSVKMEGVRLNPISTFFENLITPIALNQLAWFSSASFILLMLILAARFGIGLTSVPIQRFTIFVVIVTFTLSALTTRKYRVDYLDLRAVIVAEQAPVLTRPSDQSDLEFEGAPGLVVDILSETTDYYNVLFENKRRGWIKKEMVAVI
jgi:tetratricopeptide (TPR) repeat protein